VTLRSPRLLLALAALIVVRPAQGADPAPVAGAPPPSVTKAPGQSDAAVAVETDLRAEYLAGAPIGLVLRLRNTTGAAVSVADLSSRPWLVEFVLTPEGKQVTRRKNTPPAVDAGREVSLPPQGQRQTTLEVPLSSKLGPGRYTLAIQVDLGGGRLVSVPPTPFVIAPAKVLSVDFAECDDPRGGAATLFSHQATGGQDLYLWSGADPTAPVMAAASFLLRAPNPTAPRLSRVQAGSTERRHVLWLEGDRFVHFARIDVGAVRGNAGKVETPWPRVQILGAPATDGAGLLQVPLWVPAPKGAGGDLRLLTVDERGRPVFRRLTTLSAPPTDLQVLVDDVGAVQIALLTGGNLDLYSVRPGLDDAARTAALPIPGRRALKSAPGEQLVGVRPVLLPEKEGQPGGRALLVASTLGEQLSLRALSFKGEAVGAPLTQAWPAGSSLKDFSPDRAGGAGLLVERAGALAWIEGGKSSPVSALPSPYALCRDRDDRPLVRGGGDRLGARPLR
jgi:hypothetical protein